MSGRQVMTLEDWKALETQYSQNADKCNQIASFLNTQSSDMEWRSMAATQFVDSTSEYVAMLKQLQEDFTAISSDAQNKQTIMQNSNNV